MDSRARLVRYRSVLLLPPALHTDREDAFNARAAAADKPLVLMDRKNAKVQGARTRIEVCDLFTNKRQFVHVKRKTKSAILRHLSPRGHQCGGAAVGCKALHPTSGLPKAGRPPPLAP